MNGIEHGMMDREWQRDRMRAVRTPIRRRTGRRRVRLVLLITDRLRRQSVEPRHGCLDEHLDCA